MTARRHDIIEIAAEFRLEREKAIAICDGSTDENGREVWAWLPRSLVEDNGDGTFSMPEWLALEKGLI